MMCRLLAPAFVALGLFSLAAAAAPAGSLNERLLAMAPAPGYYLVEAKHLHPDARKGVLIVSEPHLNVEGQQRLYFVLKRTFDGRRGRDPILFCVESAEGDFDLSKHRTGFAADPKRYQAAVSLGLLSGWELYALENRRVCVTGVEHAAQYRKQIEQFDATYSKYAERVRGLGEKATQELLAAVKVIGAGADEDKAVALSAAYMDIVGTWSVLQPGEREAFFASLPSALDLLAPDLHDRNVAVAKALEKLAFFVANRNDYAAQREKVGTDKEFLASIDTQARVTAVAAERDATMAEETLKAMGRLNADLAVLFIGNFHRDGICQKLTEAGVSWAYAEHTYMAPSTEIKEDEVYLKRLQGTQLRTMPPSYLNPIAHKGAADVFASTLEALSSARKASLSHWVEEGGPPRTGAADTAAKNMAQTTALIAKASGEQEKPFAFVGAVVQTLATKQPAGLVEYLAKMGITVTKSLSNGASGDIVFEMRLADGKTCIGKIFRDAEKGRRDVKNVRAINARARAEGMEMPYAEYLAESGLEVGGEKYLLTVQECLAGETLEDALRSQTFEEAAENLAKMTKRAEDVRHITNLIRKENPDLLSYDEKDTTPVELLEKLRAKIKDSEKLNGILYQEQANKDRLATLYKQLDQVIASVLDRPGTFAELDVVRDVHPGNFFLTGDGRFIDSADDTIGPVCKRKALELKETCVRKLDLAKLDLDNAENRKVVENAFDSIIGKDVTDTELAGILGFLEVYRRSDSRAALGKPGDLPSLNPAVSDAERVRLLKDKGKFRDRRIKNYLIIEFLRIYNDRLNKGFGDRLKFFEDCYRQGLFVQAVPAVPGPANTVG
jgi:Ser/Thr protein kinase RdoA (MazF antagonist)